jgi:hypothetical protein
MQHAHVRLTIALLPASRRRRWPSGSLMAVSDSPMRSASSLRQARETRPPGPEHHHWTGNTCLQGTKTRRRPSAARGQGRNTRRCKPRPVADEAHWVTRGYPKPAAEPADSATGCSRLAPPTLPHSRARLCMSRARRGHVSVGKRKVAGDIPWGADGVGSIRCGAAGAFSRTRTFVEAPVRAGDCLEAMQRPVAPQQHQVPTGSSKRS